MKEMTPKEVSQAIKNNKDVSIIDVREDEEVAEGMIPGALHIPLGQIQDRIDDIDKDKEHVMVCRSGGRSGKAGSFLEKEGYNVINMTGGMLDWEDEVTPK
ncbi:rhodanese-like domain-containing protein [Alteribacter aurantiacus]|uniref:rhodanese-like domain-containing protein n=1 Tax=Alteribacter aurantiacus TaxID=254410 RepID=UPI000414A274|nr:rhodanese-like domain-containing protein [Alteribacter aurantiacus]